MTAWELQTDSARIRPKEDAPPNPHLDYPSKFLSLCQDAIKRGDKPIIIPTGNYRLEPKGDGGELWLAARTEEH